MSQATFYKWRGKFGGMDVSLMKRLKELEAENARLKKMYAEERLKAELAREVIEKSCNASPAPCHRQATEVGTVSQYSLVLCCGRY